MAAIRKTPDGRWHASRRYTNGATVVKPSRTKQQAKIAAGELELGGIDNEPASGDRR